MKLRPTMKQVPECVALESRQLLNGTWAGAGHWQAAGHAAGDSAAVVQHGGENFAGKGARGRPAGAFTPPSATAQADMKALQGDLKTLQSEIPAAVTAAVKADQATIKTALESLTPAQRKALEPPHTRPTSGSTTPPDPSAELTKLLTAANVSSTQITQITADFAAYQTALTTTDPTLQAKITADKAALAKDFPASATGHGFDHGPGPGGPLGLLPLDGAGFGPGPGGPGMRF